MKRIPDNGELKTKHFILTIMTTAYPPNHLPLHLWRGYISKELRQTKRKVQSNKETCAKLIQNDLMNFYTRLRHKYNGSNTL
jgi:hypothetical protein